jgi:hypothetical protein
MAELARELEGRVDLQIAAFGEGGRDEVGNGIIQRMSRSTGC